MQTLWLEHRGKRINVSIYASSWVLMFFPQHIIGVTFGRKIFCRGVPSPKLLKHEAVHIKQIADYGLVGFYARYLGYFVRELWRLRDWNKAYRAIPFEVEAYREQEK